MVRTTRKFWTTVTRWSVTIDKVWIGNWIYSTITLVTTNNYDSIPEFHNPKITVTTAHIKSSHFFTSRCRVAASNGGCSPSSGFPNCP
jgi:hypothetical protein